MSDWTAGTPGVANQVATAGAVDVGFLDELGDHARVHVGVERSPYSPGQTRLDREGRKDFAVDVYKICHVPFGFPVVAGTVDDGGSLFFSGDLESEGGRAGGIRRVGTPG